MKNIKVKFDSETNSIILEEDAKVGDFVELDKISSFETYIINQVEHKYKNTIINNFKQSEEYKSTLFNLEKQKESNKLLSDEKKRLENEINLLNEQQKSIALKTIDNFKKSEEWENKNNKIEHLVQEVNKLEKEKDLLKNNQNNIINNFKQSEEYLDLIKSVNNLNNQIETLKIDKKNAIQNAILNFKQSEEYLLILKNKNELENKLKNLELSNQNKLLKIENEHSIVLNEKNNEIQKLKDEIELWKKRRNEMNIKELGEDFENYCLNEYNDTLGQYIEDCTFEKTTTTVNGSKPDFIFKIYSDIVWKNDDINKKEPELLGSVVLEMKTKHLQTSNNKRNKDHLPKLEKDRVNFGADLAILVTELELEDNFYIKKDMNYPNIIIIRPIVLIGILSIIRSIFLKKKQLVLDFINFKDKAAIKNEFESLKNEILNGVVDKIRNKAENILKSSKKIDAEVKNIQEDCRILLESHLKTIENKINDFKITKIINKINNIDE